jgi:hypothetical protein
MARPREAIESYGGRRFILSVGCGIVNTLLVIFKYIPPEIYRDIIIATVAVYIAGNSYQKVKATNERESSTDS